MHIDHNNDTPGTVTLKQELLFAWIFVLFIFSWISIDVVGRALNNFTFKTLELNANSTWHTTIIAIVVVSIELITIYYFKTMNINIYEANSSFDASSHLETLMDGCNPLLGDKQCLSKNHKNCESDSLASNINMNGHLPPVAFI